LDKEPLQYIWKNAVQLDKGSLETKVVAINRRRWTWWVAAASILFLVFGLWFLVGRKSEVGGQKSDMVKTNVEAPKSNRATITLASGEVVYLDSVGNGRFAQEGNVTLVKTADGKVIYQSTNQQGNQSTTYNTLSNPRGSKVIDLALADGSHVWLNAGSSIRYPVAFVGEERRVEMTGEAYFEVAPAFAKASAGKGEGSRTGGKMPFVVAKGDMEVMVLGTHFNVNAYDDEEDIKVTLLEGKVNVKNEAGNVTIKPGEQALIVNPVIARSGATKQPETKNDIDLEATMAWKNGLFQFNDATLQQVMRQIVRWYDVEVVYEGKIPEKIFEGKISRRSNLSQVVQILQESGVHFEITNRNLIVKP
jgi:ferric-dicitrate binding protein FerR (iron transport regulator)